MSKISALHSDAHDMLCFDSDVYKLAVFDTFFDIRSVFFTVTLSLVTKAMN